MSTVQIETNDSKVKVGSPYDRDFISKAKQIGGKWDSGAKKWVFDSRDEERVRDLCMSVYGEDGREQEDTVTLRLDVGTYDDTPGQEIRLAGRQLVSRRQRDYAVSLADNVVVLEGSFKSSGGSRKNPRIGNTSGVIVEIRDVPPTVAAKMQEEAGKAVEVVDADEGELDRKIVLSEFRTAVEDALDKGLEVETLQEIIESYEDSDVPF